MINLRYSLSKLGRRNGFGRTDALASLAVLAVLALLVVVPLTKRRAKQSLTRCTDNLRQVSRAVLNYAADHDASLPGWEAELPGDLWWWYKEKVRRYAGLSGTSSPGDTVFACPMDRGYTDPKPFCKTARFDYGSYVFNGVTLPGMP